MARPSRNRRRRDAVTAVACACAAAGVVLLAGQAAQDPQRPPFRSGTNVIRVDATVTDRGGKPVTTLTAEDFEIEEDGKPQAITSFKFVSANGLPADDRSLPIRSQSHAAAEAARDDVRTFLIFWDEYHIEQFVPTVRAKEALTRAVLENFGPTDLVGIMDPLTPISAIELTRDRRALADHVHTLKGRMGVYHPPRSPVEEAHLQVVRSMGQVEILRTQVTVTAMKAAVAHLGTLSAGRKTLIVVSQTLGGFPGRSPMSMGNGGPQGSSERDIESMATDIVRAANDSNTAVHVIDPRGLEVNQSLFGGALEMLGSGTGGDFHRTNDMPSSITRMVREVSALYLLGYTREMPLDGLFHRIKVRVKRGGFEVRARAGYWAPKAEEVAAAARKAAAAVLPPAVAGAFATLPAANAPRLIEVHTGVRPLATGRAEVTLGWAPLVGRPDRSEPATVTAAITTKDEVIERRVEPGGTRIEVPAGPVQIALTVLDASGEVLDREKRTLDAAEAAAAPLAFSTPIVHRSRGPAEYRGLAAAEQPALYAGRIFTRTDRLLVRTSIHGAAAAAAQVTARLIDRRGATLVELPVQRTGDIYQLDLPLASVAAGEFAIVFDTVSGAVRAEALVAFRVAR